MKDSSKQKKPWNEPIFSFYQGIRNQSRLPVLVSNHQCSDSCCLIMVCEDLGLNPQRHPLCLHLLPSWGAAIHRCQVGRSFFHGAQLRTTPTVFLQRTWRGAEEGSSEWMLRSGRVLLRRSAKHDLLFIPQGRRGHTLCPWLWKIHEQISSRLKSHL